jgi:hypothetical protein
MLLVVVGLGVTAITAAAPTMALPPAPPLSGLCADTPAMIDGNPRVNSGDYVTWNQSGIAGHDYRDLANRTADFGGAHNVRPYCNAQSWCIGYTLKNDQSEVWFKTRPPVDYHGPTQGLCPHPATCPYGASSGNSLYIKCNNVTLAWRCGGRGGLYQCTSVPNTTAGPLFPLKQSCLESCKAPPPPPPPPPGPPPPAPHYDKPFLRFAMVIPVPNLVDCTVTQGATTHTWSSYGFGHFSDWITVFKAAPATISIASGGKTLLNRAITLTTGPLVIALRPDNVPVGHIWPPTAVSIETIAASYTPAPSGAAAVRLFNLSPTFDTTGIGMRVNGKPIAAGVKYGDSSTWVPVPTGQDTFTILAGGGGKELATATGTPPLSPSAATLFFYGTTQYGLFAKLLDDAPEQL